MSGTGCVVLGDSDSDDDIKIIYSKPGSGVFPIKKPVVPVQLVINSGQQNIKTERAEMKGVPLEQQFQQRTLPLPTAIPAMKSKLNDNPDLQEKEEPQSTNPNPLLQKMLGHHSSQHIGMVSNQPDQAQKQVVADKDNCQQTVQKLPKAPETELKTVTEQQPLPGKSSFYIKSIFKTLLESQSSMKQQKQGSIFPPCDGPIQPNQQLRISHQAPHPILTPGQFSESGPVGLVKTVPPQHSQVTGLAPQVSQQSAPLNTANELSSRHATASVHIPAVSQHNLSNVPQTSPANTSKQINQFLKQCEKSLTKPLCPDPQCEGGEHGAQPSVHVRVGHNAEGQKPSEILPQQTLQTTTNSASGSPPDSSAHLTLPVPVSETGQENTAARGALVCGTPLQPSEVSSSVLSPPPAASRPVSKAETYTPPACTSVPVASTTTHSPMQPDSTRHQVNRRVNIGSKRCSCGIEAANIPGSQPSEHAVHSQTCMLNWVDQFMPSERKRKRKDGGAGDSDLPGAPLQSKPGLRSPEQPTDEITAQTEVNYSDSNQVSSSVTEKNPLRWKPKRKRGKNPCSDDSEDEDYVPECNPDEDSGTESLSTDKSSAAILDPQSESYSSKKLEEAANMARVRWRKTTGFYYCSLCLFTSDSKDTLEEHCKTHKTNFPCPICKNTFKSQNVLKKHLLSEHYIGTPDKDHKKNDIERKKKKKKDKKHKKKRMKMDKKAKTGCKSTGPDNVSGVIISPTRIEKGGLLVVPSTPIENPSDNSNSSVSMTSQTEEVNVNTNNDSACWKGSGIPKSSVSEISGTNQPEILPVEPNPDSYDTYDSSGESLDPEDWKGEPLRMYCFGCNRLFFNQTVFGEHKLHCKAKRVAKAPEYFKNRSVYHCTRCLFKSLDYSSLKAHIKMHKKRKFCNFCNQKFKSYKLLTKHACKDYMHGILDPTPDTSQDGTCSEDWGVSDKSNSSTMAKKDDPDCNNSSKVLRSDELNSDAQRGFHVNQNSDFRSGANFGQEHAEGSGPFENISGAYGNTNVHSACDSSGSCDPAAAANLNSNSDIAANVDTPFDIRSIDATDDSSSRSNSKYYSDTNTEEYCESERSTEETNSVNTKPKNSSDSSEFRCHLCPMVAKSNSGLSSHIKIHSYKNIVKCQKCYKVYSNNDALKLHFKKGNCISSKNEREIPMQKKPTVSLKKTDCKPDTVSQPKPLQCFPCNFKATSKKVFQGHLDSSYHKDFWDTQGIAEQNGIYFCKPCPYRTHVGQFIYRHLQTHKHKENANKWKKAPSQNLSPVVSIPRLKDSDHVSPGKYAREDKEGKIRKEVVGHNLDFDKNENRYSKVLCHKDDEIPEPQNKDTDSRENLAVRKTVALVSDFSDFANKPYACALCFYRTDDLEELNDHIKIHLTGETAISKDSSAVRSSGNNGTMQPKSVLGKFSPETKCVPPVSTKAEVILPQKPVCSSISSGFHPGPALQLSNPYQYAGNPGYGPYLTHSQRNIPSHPERQQNSLPYSQYSTVQPDAMTLNAMYPHPQPQLPGFAAGQTCTDDLIDPGIDYVKDRTNIKPYQCLHCRERTHTFASIVGHFNTQHPDILHDRNIHAASLYSAGFSGGQQFGKEEYAPATLGQNYFLARK